MPAENYEFFVACTTGRLPFDQGSDKAIQVGIATNIKLLGDLLSR